METPDPAPVPAAAPPPFVRVPSLVPAQLGEHFSCPGCRTNLITPVGESSGLCPLCGYLIAASSNPPLPLLPLPPGATDQSWQKALQAAAAAAAAAAVAAASAAAAAAAEQEAELQASRLRAPRINRTGKFSFRPLDSSDVRDTQPEFDQEVPGSEPPEYVEYVDPRRFRFTTKLLGKAAAVLSLGLAAVVGYSWLMRGERQQPAAPEVVPVAELGKSLSAGAQESLSVILGSDDARVISEYLIGGEEMIPAVQERLEANNPFAHISEADVISPIPMNESDLRRGFSGLIYQSAPSDPTGLDGPQLSSQMAGGAAQGLMEAGEIVKNRSLPAPRRALALFVDRKGRQLLEWNLFIQTWDRTLIAFSEGELGAGPWRFRVILSLDKPVLENGEFVDQTVIRVQDPLHREDVIRIPTSAKDPVAVALVPTERELKDDPVAARKPRAATVDLVRSATGRMAFEKFVCKEFLGLGGHENVSVANSGRIDNW